MVIRHNLAAEDTLTTLNRNQSTLSKSLQKVSSGMKINGAVDDASGYAISERMRTQIRSLDQATANAQNGASMMKVAEGAVSSTVDILRTLKQKAIDAANDTNTDDDRKTIQKEFNQMIDQIDDNAATTYNGKYLIDGSHNNRVINAATVLANNNLSEPTLTAPRQLIDFEDRMGRNLGIQQTDQITFSIVNNGRTWTRTYTVGTETLTSLVNTSFRTDIEANGWDAGLAFWDDRRYYGFDSSGVPVGPPDGSRTTFVSGSANAGATVDDPQATDVPGLEFQIGGFTVAITDRYGNIKRNATNVLNDFHTVIYAQDDSDDNAFSFQIGTKSNQALKVGIMDMRAYALALRGQQGNTLNISTRDNANAAISVLENALNKALDQQTTLGAVQSRLNYTAQNLITSSENTQNAESVIRDADMAKEMTAYTKANVLTQAAQAMLSQANQNASNVISLLR